LWPPKMAGAWPASMPPPRRREPMTKNLPLAVGGAGARIARASGVAISLGFVLVACAPYRPPLPPPPPVFSYYPPPEYSAPRAPEISPVVIAPVAPEPEVVPPTVNREPEAVTAPPARSNPRTTELPPAGLPPLEPPPVKGGNEDDCVGWWRICHFL
jgi:hypothetical protein